jgi:hypothetical protein
MDHKDEQLTGMGATPLSIVAANADQQTKGEVKVGSCLVGQ